LKLSPNRDCGVSRFANFSNLAVVVRANFLEARLRTETARGRLYIQVASGWIAQITFTRQSESIVDFSCPYAKKLSGRSCFY